MSSSYPPQPPRGNDSSSAGGGSGGGYLPPPPTIDVVVGLNPNKLTANNDHNSQTPTFDQLATGSAHLLHEQPHRNEPPPPPESTDRWPAMLPMHHHHRPPLDLYSQYRDWGRGRDEDRTERPTNLQLGSSSADGVKEPPAMEDREVDISGRTPERETRTKQKDHDGRTTADRQCRERRKERDGDVEHERPEKRNRCYDKDSDGGCAQHTDEGTEKQRRGFTYGVRQRKRMLHPKGCPQLGNPEPRLQDNEGRQGKPEVSTVVYRVGKCMQELIKLWKEYESSQADKNGESSQASLTLEIWIPAEYVKATNQQVRGGQVWGTDVYTDDSDLVAVLMHTGYCRPTASPPPAAIQELRATVRVLPPQDCYTSTLRNNVRSRAWGAAVGCSYCVERCCIFMKGGEVIDLEPCLTHTSTVEPTLAPAVVEHTMTTRAAGSNALRQQRFVREVTIEYNLCNEPWVKYSLSAVADKGLKKPLYTSSRLKRGEVLYLETNSRRYELCFTGEKMVKAAISSQTQTDVERNQCHNLHSTNGEGERGGLMVGDTVLIDVFRWSRCKRPLPQNLCSLLGFHFPMSIWRCWKRILIGRMLNGLKRVFL